MRDLKGPHKAAMEPLICGQTGDVMAIENDPAFIGQQGTGKQVEGRGLARSIRPNQSGDRPRHNAQRTAVHGAKLTKPSDQLCGFQKRGGSCRYPGLA